MNATSHSAITTLRPFGAVISATVLGVLTFATVFASASTSIAAPHPTHATSAQCAELANATPGSPAAFRLAETIAGSGQKCPDMGPRRTKAVLGSRA